NGCRVPGGFIRASDGRGGEGGRGDRAGGHVVAIDLFAVEVNDGAVVANEPQRERGNGGRVGDAEALAEVGGDELVVGVGSVGDDGGFVAVAVAELGGAGFPGGIVEV